MSNRITHSQLVSIPQNLRRARVGELLDALETTTDPAVRRAAYRELRRRVRAVGVDRPVQCASTVTVRSNRPRLVYAARSATSSGDGDADDTEPTPEPSRGTDPVAAFFVPGGYR